MHTRLYTGKQRQAWIWVRSCWHRLWIETPTQLKEQISDETQKTSKQTRAVHKLTLV